VPALLGERGDIWDAKGWREQRLEPALKAAQTKWREDGE
jgi:hypothetical protein